MNDMTDTNTTIANTNDTTNTDDIRSARVPDFWQHAAQRHGLVDDGEEGHEGTREQWQAFGAWLDSLDRSKMDRGGKVSHTLVRQYIGFARE